MLWLSHQACAKGTSEGLHGRTGEVGWGTCMQWRGRAAAEFGACACWGCVLIPRTVLVLPCPLPFFTFENLSLDLGDEERYFLLFRNFGKGNTRLQSSWRSLCLGMMQKSVPPTVSTAGGGESPGVSWDGLAWGGPRKRIKVGWKCGPFCRRWQNQWASVLLNYWRVGR